MRRLPYVETSLATGCTPRTPTLNHQLVAMSEEGTTTGRKRARFFGSDPVPGFVFSLDTSQQPLDLLSQTWALQHEQHSASSSCFKHTSGEGGERADSSLAALDATVRAITSTRGSRDVEGSPLSRAGDVGEMTIDGTKDAEASLDRRDEGTPNLDKRSSTIAVAGTPDSAARECILVDSLRPATAPRESDRWQGDKESRLTPPCSTTTTPAAAAVAAVNIGLQASADHHCEARAAKATEPGHQQGGVARLACAPVSATPTAKPPAVATTNVVGDAERQQSASGRRTHNLAADAGRRRAFHGTATVAAPAAAQGNHTGVSAGAASMVASFLKKRPVPATPARLPAPSVDSPKPSPTTPTSLESLVTGLPFGSGGARGNRGLGSMPSAATEARGKGGSPRPASDSCAWSPVRVGGCSRFFNDEWPPRLKERRRIIKFPKRSEPAGTRIVYWVRGNYRVRDNLALSVAMWLSTKLRMPLQALTFVDPTIGRCSPLRQRSPAGQRQGHGGAQDAQHLPFRAAVEASALCEMEEALRALKVPLVAVACAESEIPAALARWCCAAQENSSSSSSSFPAAAITSPAVSPASASSAATRNTRGLPGDGGVHVVITDESYHPRQLWLMSRVKDVISGVALYTVDSSCVCPVNTFRPERVATAAAAEGAGAAEAVAEAGPSKYSSPEGFRKAQDDLLPVVHTELAPRPRLPLEAQLQQPAMGVRSSMASAAIPRGFEGGPRSTMPSAVVIDWGVLREIVVRHFPGFANPTGRDASVSRKDLIATMGGGERVGEASLQQTLDMIASLPQTGQAAPPGTVHDMGGGGGERASQDKYMGLESELSGIGFGGSLLHLLRLGSISSLCVVQALLDRMHGSDGWGIKGGQHSKGLARLLEAVLKREYALYRSFSYYQREGCLRAGIVGAARGGSVAVPELRGWRATDWMGMLPAWVLEELRRGQRDAKQHPRSPGEIRSAGSVVPSSVQDPLFSAIQVRLTNGARLHPTLAPYWARAVVKMVLIPSQAISLIIEMADDLCLGAKHAGDIAADLLADALDGFRDTPPSAAASSSGDRTAASRDLPVFRRLSELPLASLAALEAALGGADALERFVKPFALRVPPPS